MGLCTSLAPTGRSPWVQSGGQTREQSGPQAKVFGGTSGSQGHTGGCWESRSTTAPGGGLERSESETRRVVSLWMGGSTWGPRRWWSRTGSAGPDPFVGHGVMIPGLAAARMRPSEWRGREIPILPMAMPILFSDSIFLLLPPTLYLEHSSQPRLPEPLRVLAA